MNVYNYVKFCLLPLVVAQLSIFVYSKHLRIPLFSVYHAEIKNVYSVKHSSHSHSNYVYCSYKYIAKYFKLTAHKGFALYICIHQGRKRTHAACIHWIVLETQYMY